MWTVVSRSALSQNLTPKCIANAPSHADLSCSKFQIQLPLQPSVASYEAMFPDNSFCVGVTSFSSARIYSCLVVVWLWDTTYCCYNHIASYSYVLVVQFFSHYISDLHSHRRYLVVTLFPQMNHINGDLFSCWWSFWWWLLLVMTHASATLRHKCTSLSLSPFI